MAESINFQSMMKILPSLIVEIFSPIRIKAQLLTIVKVNRTAKPIPIKVRDISPWEMEILNWSGKIKQTYPKSKIKQTYPKSKIKQTYPKSKIRQTYPKSKIRQTYPKSKIRQTYTLSKKI